MNPRIYIDNNILQALIESGYYDVFRNRAAELGYDFATTTRIIYELGDGVPSDEVVNWLKNRDSNIIIELHPDNIPWTDDAGERGALEIFRIERANGNSTSEFWSSDNAALANIRQSPVLRDMTINSIGSRQDVHGRPVESLIERFFGYDQVRAHEITEAMRPFANRNNNLNPDPAKFTNHPSRSEHFLTPEDRGLVRYTRVVENIVEERVGLPGVPPEGPGWRSDAELRASAPVESQQMLDGGRQRANAEAENIRNNPNSYDGQGNTTAEASAALRGAARAAAAAGVAAALYDAIKTGQEVRDLLDQGRPGDAALAEDAFIGRLFGGLYGAELGISIGRGIGPWGVFFGAIAGGIVGAVVGELALRQATQWVLEALGASFIRRDPLVFDLNFDGVRLTPLTGSTVHFDFDGDGFAERTGWVSARDGLLALDRNGNGVIDNGLELFGTTQRDGFAVLSDFDTNGDNMITSADAVFGDLRIWRDANQDGISQASELLTLSQAGIVSINLAGRASTETRSENGLISVGSFTGPSGLTGEVAAVAFATDQVNTHFELPAGFQYDPEVFGLPNLRGYGQLPDLWVAMSLDPVLKQMVKDLLNGNFESIDASSGHQYAINHMAIVDANGHVLSDGWTEYDYKASAFDNMVARWAGVPINGTDSDKYQAIQVAEALVNRPILGHQPIFDGVPITNPDFFVGYVKLSAGLVARFYAQIPDLLERRQVLALMNAFAQAVPANGVSFTAAEYAALTDPIFASIAAQAAAFDPDLQQFAGLTYDYRTDQVTGDLRGAIGRLMANLPYDPQAPWAGFTDWFMANQLALLVLDPDGSITNASYRAHTENHALGILMLPHNTYTGTAGADIIDGSTGPLTEDLLIGGAGDDLLRGGSGNDTYAFEPGSGHDEINDSGGDHDEIAFQGSFVSTDARYSFAGGSRTDLLISFVDRDETVLVRNYFLASGAATIEAITFADGVTVNQRYIRDAVMYGLGTNGNDAVTAFAIGSRVVGGPGADVLTGQGGDDVFETGAGNDIAYGGGGNDTYRFYRGDGQDIISEYENRGSGFDTLEFGAGISPDDIVVSQSNSGLDIVLKIAGTSDQVTISYGNAWYNEYRVDQVKFVDGTIWSFADLLARAMAPTDGNDTIYGSFDDDDISGGAGDDVIYAGAGSDKIIGGKGNDTLYGGAGADSYIFNLGDGQDIISEFGQGSGGHDRIVFGEGIAPEDIIVTQANNGLDIVLSIAGTTDRVTISYGNAWYPEYRVDEVVFANGTSWTFADLLARATAPTAGDDVIYGSIDGESLSGGAGNDWISANAGNDILIGGTGNDTLFGGAGDDIYRFNLGDGQDVISEYGEGGSGFDALVFGDGIAASDIIISQANSGLDIVLSIAGTGDKVTISYGNAWYNQYRVDEVRFTDGTVWSFSELIARASGGTPGNDTIYGSNDAESLAGGAGDDVIFGGGGDDILTGGTGNDTLYGGAGSDSYVFNLGDGQDIISEFGQGSSGHDRIVFGEGIAPEDIIVTQANNGLDIVLSIAGTTDRVTISYGNAWYPEYRVDEVVFANGTSWTFTDLLARATAPTAGNDVIYGSIDGESLSGGGGDDWISANAGNDILNGGTGNDTLLGGAGDDIYRFNLGDGQDIINEYDGGSGYDRLVFGAGIAPGDVIVSQANDGYDFVLKIAGTTDQVTIRYGNAWYNEYRVDEVNFADGTVWTLSDLMARLGSPGNDMIRGRFEADTINGGAGDDIIRGEGGDDILSGGIGNDTIYGGGGNDTYLFSLGDGQDIINEYDGGSGYDRLVFGAGIAPGDVIVSQANDGYDFVLKIAGTADQVTIRYGNAWYNEYRVDEVNFADGTVWTLSDLMARLGTPGNDVIRGRFEADTINGGAGDDIIRGDGGDDILSGGTGNDTIFGGSGNDTYLFSLGDGQDVINEFDGGSGYDKLVFGAGVAPDDIKVTQVNNGYDMVLSITGTTDQVTIRYGNSWSGDYRVDEVRFADGTVWNFSQLLARMTTAGADHIHGNYESQTLNGGAGDDWIDGRGGDDILIGGTGNDFLSGGGGNDTYRFARGDGNDTIQEYVDSDSGRGGNDTIELGAGIMPEDVVVSRAGNGNDLLLDFGQGDSIYIAGSPLNNSDGQIENVIFANSVIWSAEDLKTRALGSALLRSSSGGGSSIAPADSGLAPQIAAAQLIEASAGYSKVVASGIAPVREGDRGFDVLAAVRNYNGHLPAHRF